MFDLKLFHDNIAVYDENRVITYEELFEDCKKFKSYINARGLMLILASNTYDSLLGYVASLQFGIVPIMLDCKLDKLLVQKFIEIYKPNYLWCPQEIFFDFSYQKELFETQRYKLFCINKNKIDLFPDLALLLSTSGSTGSPKLVRQSYNNISTNTKSIIDYLKIVSSDKAITSLPMHYTFGLSIINSHLMSGASIFLTEYTLFNKEFWEIIKNNSITSLSGVPYTFEILDRLRFYDMDLPSLRTITQAGGKLSSKLHEKFAGYAKSSNKKFYVMYGQTEATARMGYLPPEYALIKIGAMGIAIPGGRFQLLDENENIINFPEIIGELIYYGENVTLGYATNIEDLNRGDDNLGCLKTGDMAKFDSDGFFYIVGRKKRFIKIFGNRINLDEIEKIVGESFNNMEVACTGEDDLLQVYVTTQGVEKDLQIFISEKLKLNRHAVSVIFINEIPRNSSGKIIYSKLNEI